MVTMAIAIVDGEILVETQDLADDLMVCNNVLSLSTSKHILLNLCVVSGDRRGRGGRGGRNHDSRGFDDSRGGVWGSDDRNDDDRRGGQRGDWGSDDKNDDRRGGGRSFSGRNDDDNRDGDGVGNGEEPEKKPQPVTYVPQERTEDELFNETGKLCSVMFLLSVSDVGTAYVSHVNGCIRNVE